MIDQQAEFQGFPATQRETASESSMQRFLRLSEEHGALVPQAWLQDELGVSKQRIHQFLSEGRFHVYEVGSTCFVLLSEVEAFKAQPRKTGRPKKS
jgi:predicted 3-demethylubiquinone-9 3-methyltransferase (glyoxalase superfamily)